MPFSSRSERSFLQVQHCICLAHRGHRVSAEVVLCGVHVQADVACISTAICCAAQPQVVLCCVGNVTHAGFGHKRLSAQCTCVLTVKSADRVGLQLTKPQSATAAAGAPAGVPQLPARPAAATAAAEAAAKRAAAASVAASDSSGATNTSAVNNGPAIKQAAGEIADAAGLAMADAGIPQTSGQSMNGTAGHSQAANGHAGTSPAPKGPSKQLPTQPVPAASAKDVSMICYL